MKIVMSLVDSDSGPYIKDSDTKTIEIKRTNGQVPWYTITCTLGASLIGNILA